MDTSDLTLTSMVVVDEVAGSDSEDDCQIQEPNISCITLDCSYSFAEPAAAAAVEAVKDQVVIVEPDDRITEEGEICVIDEEPTEEVKGQVLVSINFKEKKHYDSLKKCLKEYLLISFKSRIKDQNIETEEDDVRKVIQIRKKPEKPIKKKSEKPVIEDDIFIIDKAPSKDSKKSLIPSYKKKTTTKVLDDKIIISKDAGLFKGRAKNVCWNCDGDHSIRECKEPRNFTKINKAKKDFVKKNDRYHIDIEQKYGHFVPGKLSEHLRQALGLKRRELPLHVYRMRLFGYPPGWLEEAKVKHSGLTMFDSKGEKVLESDEDDGEIDNDKDKYDIRKIIKFPGFNVKPDKDAFEDSKYHNVPPMMDHQSREALIESLQGNLVQGYKRKKLRTGTTIDESTDSLIANEDMEVENADEDVITIEDSVTEISDLEMSFVIDKEGEKVDEEEPTPPKSPSLDDLKLQQERLLAQLDGDITLEDSLIDDILFVEKVAEENEKLPPQPPEEKKPPPPRIEEMNLVGTALGTPVLQPFSPFSKLPKGENFSVGVSDVINFENLPDSTGKYETMKTLIYKVRDVTAKLNAET